jgi:glutaredoxin
MIFTAVADEVLTLYVFGSQDCVHCEAQKPFLQSLAEQHPKVTVRTFEVLRTAHHHDRFRAMALAHGVDAGSIPTIFAGGRAWVGDSTWIREQITRHVAFCLAQGCPDSEALVEASKPKAMVPPPPATAVVSIPLIGAVDLSLQPLLVSTSLIALVDGFNPCSLWVLTILLALVIHSRSRSRVLIVGLTFLAVTAAIYGLFVIAHDIVHSFWLEI